jgi:hypothetical protein
LGTLLLWYLQVFSSLVNKSEEFSTGNGVVAKAPKQFACHELRAIPAHAPADHAKMRAFDEDGHTLWLKNCIDCAGYLGRQAFLNLEPSRINLDHAQDRRVFGDAPVRQVRDPSSPDDWCNMMFAMAMKWNAAQCNHLMMIASRLEAVAQNACGVLSIARKAFCESAP